VKSATGLTAEELVLGALVFVRALTAAEMVERTGLSKSAVHKALARLSAEPLTERDKLASLMRFEDQRTGRRGRPRHTYGMIPF
jgi:predicted transcriptional regulator